VPDLKVNLKHTVYVAKVRVNTPAKPMIARNYAQIDAGFLRLPFVGCVYK
jgi:hypothetical protein